MTSPAASVPRDSYLCLRGRPPVLDRAPGEVQIGVDQERALVLVGVHPALRQVLTLFDGRHALTEIGAEARRLGIRPDHFEWCLRRLVEAELVVDRTGHLIGPAAGGAWRVRLVGAGRLGRDVANKLLNNVVSHLYVVDDQPPDPSLYPSPGVATSQADALAAEWDPAARPLLRVVNHWSKPETPAPDLTIVACDLIECDRVVADGLLRADQPHLFVRAGGGGAVVGPFVIPGRSACLHCTDLARRDADPAWPTLLPQLVRARAPLSTASASWAGSVAATQALAFLHGAAPETYGATIELSATDFLTRWRFWPMHPDCGCGWGSPAEWGT